MSVIKKTIKKVAPALADQVRHTRRKIDSIDLLTRDMSQKIDKLVSHDSRIDKLKASYAAVEPYQPIYNVRDVGEDPRRSSDDRAEKIYEFFDNNVKNLRTLDIGCSLGYISFYLADRGAIAEGWDYNAKNIEVCRYAYEVTGIPVTFYVKEFNLDAVEAIQPGQYDSVIILSLLHHITALYGVEYTQKMLKALLDRIPVMIVELALKGEDTKLSWDKALPKHELDIFGDLKGYTVTKLGTYSTHLSGKKRPLYAIRKSSLVIRNRHYQVEEIQFKPFKYAPRTANYQRVYYSSKKAFIKQYAYTEQAEDNKRQIFNEINFYMQNQDTLPKGIPKLIDFDVRINQAELVFERIDGTLLGENNAGKTPHNNEKIARDVIDVLAYLETKGLHHNDIRSWNIMTTDKNTYLIDFGLVSPTPLENDAIAFLWAMWGVMQDRHEEHDQGKQELPDRSAFTESTKLVALYDAISKNKSVSFKVLKSLTRG
jgi:2-polyprenyl-3-methyl-5-hydroxy-6-metoxy-1,4-benzoquinol methylase/tRNA A-37 threonylcarbamoyl transferase component Bud32